MQVAIVSSKPFVPSPHPDLIHRPRLIDQLDAGLRQGHRLTLIAAPAGFGKTTLAGEWVHRLDRAFAWLSLENDDTDPFRFIGCLVAALQYVHDGIGATIQTALESRQLPSLEWLLARLIDDIAALPIAFVLVLDDGHIIQSPCIYELLEILLGHQPPQLHLALLTRATPPLSLARLRAADQLTEIRADDLRFTTAEIAAFFTQTHRLPLAPPLIATLEARTEGWIAGLQLAALSLHGRPDLAECVHAFKGDHRYVIDYLAEEVLRWQPDDRRMFLRQTAILERLSAPLCDAVLGLAEQASSMEAGNSLSHTRQPPASAACGGSPASASYSQHILEAFERDNLFLMPLDERRIWYRYHPLFAEFLRSTLGADEQPLLHRRAAQWYQAHGSLYEAVGHALAADDPDAAVQMIAAAAVQAFEQGELKTLLGWLEALPDAHVRASADLATYKGWALWLTGQVAAAEDYARSAEAHLRPDAPPVSRGRLTSLRAYLAGTPDAQTMRLAQDALDLLDQDEPFFRGLTLLYLAYVQLANDDTAAAQATFHTLVQLSQQHGLCFTAAIGFHELALACARQGKRREAIAICRRAITQLVDPHGQPLSVACGVYLTAGRLAYAANHLAEAQQYVETGLDLAQQLGLAPAILVGKIDLARLKAALGATEAALATLAEAQALVAQADILDYADRLAAIAAELQARHGNLAAAARPIVTANRLASLPSWIWWEPAYGTFARLLLAQRRLPEALDLLATMERREQQCEHFGRLVPIYTLQAIAHHLLGHGQQALGCLTRAVELAAPEDERRVFLDAGQPLLDLLPLVCQVAPTFVEQVLSDAGIQPATPPQALAESLSMREVEIVRLIAIGLSNQEIANQLVIAPGTVKKHLDHIYGKLGVHRRAQAAARAHVLGLL